MLGDSVVHVLESSLVGTSRLLDKMQCLEKLPWMEMLTTTNLKYQMTCAICNGVLVDNHVIDVDLIEIARFAIA